MRALGVTIILGTFVATVKLVGYIGAAFILFVWPLLS